MALECLDVAFCQLCLRGTWWPIFVFFLGLTGLALCCVLIVLDPSRPAYDDEGHNSWSVPLILVGIFVSIWITIISGFKLMLNAFYVEEQRDAERTQSHTLYVEEERDDTERTLSDAVRSEIATMRWKTEAATLAALKALPCELRVQTDGDDSIDCAVCLEQLDGTLARTLPCNHAFHQGCIDAWFTSDAMAHRRRFCPICKADPVRCKPAATSAAAADAAPRDDPVDHGEGSIEAPPPPSPPTITEAADVADAALRDGPIGPASTDLAVSEIEAPLPSAAADLEAEVEVVVTG